MDFYCFSFAHKGWVWLSVVRWLVQRHTANQALELQPARPLSTSPTGNGCWPELSVSIHCLPRWVTVSRSFNLPEPLWSNKCLDDEHL